LDCGAILESIGFGAADTYNGDLFLQAASKPPGTVPIFRSGTVRRMVGEKNGTVPFSQAVLKHPLASLPQDASHDG